MVSLGSGKLCVTEVSTSQLAPENGEEHLPGILQEGAGGIVQRVRTCLTHMRSWVQLSVSLLCLFESYYKATTTARMLREKQTFTAHSFLVSGSADTSANRNGWAFLQSIPQVGRMESIALLNEKSIFYAHSTDM